MIHITGVVSAVPAIAVTFLAIFMLQKLFRHFSCAVVVGSKGGMWAVTSIMWVVNATMWDVTASMLDVTVAMLAAHQPCGM